MNRALLPALLLAALLTGCSDPTSTPTPGPVTRHETTAAPSSSAGPTRSSPFVPSGARAHVASWHLPYAVAREAAVQTIGTSVTLAGGLLPGDETTGRALRLDLASGHSRPLRPLLVPVHDTAAGLVAGNPTVVGGGNTSEQSVVQTWENQAWHRVGRLPTTRSDLSLVEWHRHAFAIGGYDGTSEPTAILRVSRGVAQPVGALIHGVRYAATARVGSSVFVFGGEDAGREADTIQRVDLATGGVQPAGHLPVPLGHAMAATVGGRILVMGGRVTPSLPTDAMWWFDPTTGRFHRAGHLPSPLSDAAVASYRRRIWLLGGETPTVTDSVTVVGLR